jgi:uncharacterized membrane protein YeaQ/YmgE (transglycosylase-associated protein family)
MFVNAIGWILLGLITGCVASKLVRRRREGLFRDILLGIVGAVASGCIFIAVGATSVTAVNTWSLMVAVVGAVAFLVAWHLMVGVIGGTVVLLVVWDAIQGSASPARGSRNRKERI